MDLDTFAGGTPVVSRSSESVASFPVPHRADLPLLSLSVETSEFPVGFCHEA